MELVRFAFRALLLASALGLIVELFVPGGERFVDIAAAVFAGATWAVPLLMSTRWHIRPPRTSLGSVGLSISRMASALSLSLMTIALAILDFIFAHSGEWAWHSLPAVGGFWVAGPCQQPVREAYQAGYVQLSFGDANVDATKSWAYVYSQSLAGRMTATGGCP